ncbi:hypothetical protein GYMLUDRAFT_34693 [Collybiopsis luxurians FD-317 M1]|nr:hypothetical protein GYMLUDRAFT_34693 [Collybiopsis luxurians FD-317 M1]
MPHPCPQCGENVLNPRIDADFTSIQERLRSQSGPASVQRGEIASILNDIALDLEDYDAEIHRLKARIFVLETQQDRLKEYSVQIRALSSPVRKLPDELLCRIFDECCGMNCFAVNELPLKTAYSLRDVPAMAIGSVCSRWRKIALSLPSIWSRISLRWEAPVTDSEVQDGERSLLLDNLMARSLSYPLTLVIHVNRRPYTESGRLHPIIAKLIQQVHRWQCLTFFSFVFSIEELFLDPPSCFPLLEFLYLYTDDMNFFTERTSQVKKLTLEGFIHSEPFVFPSAQITHMVYALPCSQRHLHTFLDANPNLVSLALPEASNDLGGRPRTKTCSRLETLIVRHPSTVTGSVLQLLNCPSLKTLRFEVLEDENPVEEPWANFNSLMAFVQRSSFPLTTLLIQGLALSDANLVYLLNHIPTLMNLTVDDSCNIWYQNLSPITKQFIDSLHAYRTCPLRSNAKPIVPKLRSLTLVTAAFEFEDVSVVDMVRSRWIPSAAIAGAARTSSLQTDCLREFTLRFPKRRKVKSAVYAPLEYFEKSGMRVVVLWRT